MRESRSAARLFAARYRILRPDATTSWLDSRADVAGALRRPRGGPLPQCRHRERRRPYVCAIDDTRCPTCSRPLVRRSGPAVRTHFAHRPRQSCRTRSGRAAVRPLRLEQLALFEWEPTPPPPEPGALPAFIYVTRPADMNAEGVALARRRPVPPRRRRKAWLPRLIRWVKVRAARRD